MLAASVLMAGVACADRAVAPADGSIDVGSEPAGRGSGTAKLTLAPDAPSEIVGGEAVTIRGTGFSSVPAENVVTLAGVPLTVTNASSTALTATLPSTAFACGPARDAALVVDANGSSASRTVLLRSARAYALAPGASALLPAAQRCLELSEPGTRYLVTVVNAGRAVGSIAPFELAGVTSSTAGVSPAPIVASPLLASTPAAWSGDRAGGVLLDGDDEPESRRMKLHHRILETNRGLRARLGHPGVVDASSRVSASPGGDGVTSPALSTGPTSTLRAAGDTATLRIPDINASNACSKFFTVQTRVAYAGTRALVLEDVRAPLAGRMDETYRSIGEEFDRVMWPILTANFGNPLAMDAKLDRNGRIVMLFSPVVNQNFTSVAGFVIGCDFYPRSQAAASNEGEVFYATVPTSLTGSLSSSASRDGWRRNMRSTIIHEAKHVTAYAERLSRGHGLEDAWLEEGTARHAEELFARALSGATWKGNAGYAAISCEVRPTTAACADRPYVMFKHFGGLADYVAANGTLSPLGQTAPTDYNYYASAWALLRWAADIAPSEAGFLQALVRGPASGVANLELVSGRPWDEILADWTLSLALDDQPAFLPQRAQGIGTWNLRDVFAGMNRDFPGTYVRPDPTVAHAATFGAFSVQGAALRGGSGALVDLRGSWAGPQILELRLPGGGAPSPTLRLAVTRVQ